MSTATHTEELVLDDAGTVADLRTFVSRARTADDGAIRLQGAGHVLAAYVCVMRGKLLGEGTPTVLGLRTMALGTPSDIDVTVSLSSVADRLARMGGDDLRLPIPPVAVHESWAGIGAPRGAWAELGTMDTDALIDVAKTGVQEIGQIIPVNPGALLVNNIRASVWGRPIDGAPGALPGGAAFAGYALGFLVPGETASVFSSHNWLRLSTARGHILVKPQSLL
ncbi:hypothetical protein JOF48_003073 [Arthrobacter stackebrandtii]|uniref:FAD-binding PCMH-type domain-containing protein n=1 Tax=Arthrobacter stackebrandtii TaxID=272161 RepID=A0ABS4YZW1_9MICC|nr:hypothetical protein [Arthrobacter stackebrandtii]MBP2414274.1 hypothetical protein [Arthrobacter stackebrandtii]PYH01437.1 hypothetical protein CVV67_02745 [Arthrobacter stackebrandtii]